MNNEHPSFMERASQVGSIVAGITGLGTLFTVGRIANTLDDALARQQYAYDPEAAAKREARLQAERHAANQAYLARVANEDNWFAPAAPEPEREPEPPPVICRPPTWK